MFVLLIHSTVLTLITAQGPQQGDVRLINGQPHQGILQVWNAGEWGYVCDDLFGNANSIVVCRQLGYWPPNPQAPIHRQPTVGDPPRYWLDNVQCRGTENRIDQCAHRGWGVHNCGPNEAVMVLCTFRDPCADNPCPSGSVCRRIDNIRYECDEVTTPKSPPAYRVSMQGIFQTQDRSVITPTCAGEYGREMELKAFDQLEEINRRLGWMLCRGTTGFEYVVVGTSVSAAQNRGITYLDFIMTGQGDHKYGEFSTCGAEVSDFLQDFKNWRAPIIPTPPGCPPVEFFGERFRDSGMDWFC